MSRRGDVPPFLAMEVAREANRLQAAGVDIVRFDVGQPHFGAPQRALDAAAAAMGKGPLGYSEGLGLRPLREAIARMYAARDGVEVDPERIAIATGASGAFILAFLALFDPGDRVAIVSPGYPPYRHIMRALDLVPAMLDGEVGEGLQLTARLLEGAAFDGALVASPANPTGAVLAPAALADLARTLKAHGKPLISDEIYHGLVYDGAEAKTALAVDPDAIVVSSFSKYWAMTGWRVGWIVAPEPIIRKVERLAQNLTVAPPTIGQVAALAALEAGDECEARRELYAANRRLLLRELPGLGLPPLVPPDGAFYALIDVSAFGEDSDAFARRALDEAGVALTPGIDFCEDRGRRWARLAYCRPADEVARGLERLAAFVRAGAPRASAS